MFSQGSQVRLSYTDNFSQQNSGQSTSLINQLLKLFTSLRCCPSELFLSSQRLKLLKNEVGWTRLTCLIVCDWDHRVIQNAITDWKQRHQNSKNKNSNKKRNSGKFMSESSCAIAFAKPSAAFLGANGTDVEVSWSHVASENMQFLHL